MDVDSHWKQVTNVNKPEFEKLQMVEDDELLAMRLYQVLTVNDLHGIFI